MNSIEFSSMATMMPSVSNISKDMISQNDTNNDNSLSIDELDIEESLFSSIDSDSDGLLTKNEIATAIDSALSDFGDEMPSKEEFSSILSELGLELPEPPEKPNSEDFVSELMSTYDTDGDSLLSADEVSILTDEEFSALDTDEDGSISEDELTAAVDSASKGEGAPPPPPSGGGGGGSSSSEEETYSQYDLNEDGVVSQEELAEALGIGESDEDTETTSDSTLDNIKLLFETLKLNSEDSEDLDISNFSNLMKMANNQNNTSDLNTYVNNISSTTQNYLSGYA